MELKLLGRNDEEARCYVLPNGETSIGRKPDCGIVLNAPSIATRHARVFSIDERAVIYGISPEWPVYVNGDPVRRRVLEDGDNIELAHYRLCFVRRTEPGHTAEYPSQPVELQPFESAAEDASGGSEISEETAVRPALELSPAPPLRSATEPSLNTRPETPSEEFFAEIPRESEEHEASSAELGESAIEGDALIPPSSPFHLDILSGINQGRRVTLTQNRVILGFDQQRLVEIKTTGDELTVRILDDGVDARLNDEPIDESFTEALPGDMLWLRRISMRIHQD